MTPKTRKSSTIFGTCLPSFGLRSQGTVLEARRSRHGDPSVHSKTPLWIAVPWHCIKSGDVSPHSKNPLRITVFWHRFKSGVISLRRHVAAGTCPRAPKKKQG